MLIHCAETLVLSGDFVWHGMAWYGMVWHGVAWYGMICNGLTLYGMDMDLFGMEWHGVAGHLTLSGWYVWV